MKKFKKGDTVKLNSGGPLMTVEEVKDKYSDGVKIEGYDVDCVWFIQNEPREGRFDQDMLSRNDGDDDGFIVA